MARRAFMKMNKIVVCFTVASILLGASAIVMPGENVSAVESATHAKRNVMYYGDWSIWGGQGNFYPKDIPADQLTHLNFAFLDFDKNGNLVFTDKDAAVGAPVGQEGVQWGGANAGILQAFQELRAQNPNLKIGVSLGGWSKSGDFSEVAADKTKREALVNNVMKFLDYTNMDFVDVDWEYPASVREADKVDNQNDEGTPNARPEDKENYILLLKDLRKALDEQGKALGKTYELSVALPAAKEKLDLGIDVKELFNTVDFANIMTYDLRGAWDETSGHQTGLYTNPNDPTKGKGYSVDESVDYLLDQGAAANKIVIGAAYYTRGWEKVSSEGTSTETPGLFGKAEVVNKDADQTPTRGAENEAPCKAGDSGRKGGVWSYRSLDELKKKYPGLKEYWDDTAKAPYLYDEATGAFFTYDNVKSITEKSKYVNENKLGGMIAWMASQDATTDSTKRDELTKATKQGLFGDEALPTFDIKYKELDITCTVKPYAEAGTTNQGYEITIKNNEKAEESDAVLKEVEKSSETIKMPKLYIYHDAGNLSAGDSLAGKVTNEGGYTVVDISGVYEGATIAQGGSYTLKLKSDKAVEDASAIESIELSQRILSTGAELGKQTLYGTVAKPGENNVPTIKGAADTTISLGDKFDPMEGVTAKDREDGDLTSKVSVSGTVDNSKVGKYTLTYTVKDSAGAEAKVERIVNVQEKPVEVYPEWSVSTQNAQGYAVGSKVTHNGKTYIQTGGANGNLTCWYGEPGTSAGDIYWKEI